MFFDVSVIIPVYNTEKYLRECLDSVTAQTLKNIEIICVNDGSQDNSLQILNEYAEKDSRIKVINQPNSGVTSARKAGLAVANAEYIGFIDSDDWVEPDFYEQLYSTIIDNDADMVTSGVWIEGNYITIALDGLEEGLYCDDKMKQLQNNFIYDLAKRITPINGFLWNKLYKKSAIVKAYNQVPDSVVIAEDRACISTLILNCNRVYIMRSLFCHHRINSGSITDTVDTDYLLKINEFYKYMRSLYNRKNFSEKMITQVELYVLTMLSMGINKMLGFQHKYLFKVDPYYLDKIPKQSKIVIYGGGLIGEIYYNQLLLADINVIACIDYEYDHITNDSLNAQTPDILNNIDYNFILITIRDARKTEEIKKRLISNGIESDKILWFKQQDFFWKYAEANGLLN